MYVYHVLQRQQPHTVCANGIVRTDYEWVYEYDNDPMAEFYLTLLATPPTETLATHILGLYFYLVFTQILPLSGPSKHTQPQLHPVRSLL